MRSWGPPLVVLALVACPAAARAQPDDVPLPGDATVDAQDDAERTYRGRWWLDLGFYSGDETPDASPGIEVPQTSATVLTAIAGGTYTLPSAPVAFEVRAGLAAFFLSAEGADTQSTVRPTNPLVAAYYADRFGRIDVHAGLGLALPIASLRSGGDTGEDAILDAAAYVYAAAVQGLWDWYAWSPDRFTLLLPTGSVEARIGQNLRVGGELALQLLFSTASAEETVGGVTVTTDTSTDAVFQLGGELAYQTHTTRSGLLLRVATLLTGGDGSDPDEDRTQLSIEPYLRFDVGSGFLRLALTVNLDEPFGFSFSSDPLKVWGLHVGGGTRF